MLRAMTKRVTLRELGDPVEANMLVDLLEQEGIYASTPGNQHNAVMGGLLSGALRVPLQVPEEDAERAREILDALEDYDEVDPEDAAPSAPTAEEMEGDGPYRGGRREDGPPPRKKTVAIAAALIMPMILAAFGSGHFYVRSYGRGFGLLFAAWTSIVLALSGQKWAWLALVAVVIADIVGALSVIDRQNA